MNRRCLGVGQESLPLDHGTIPFGAEAVGLEPTIPMYQDTCFQDRLLIRPDDFRFPVAGAGIEPTSGRSERPVLPLDDPAKVDLVPGVGIEPTDS